MRKKILILLAILAAAVQPLHAASDWLTVAKDRLRKVEIDRGSVLQSDAGNKVAWGRIVLADSEAQRAGYRSVRALNRYDCRGKSFVIVKRVYLGDDDRVLREEAVDDSRPLRVRTNTVDERFFNEVCKPPSLADLQQVAQAASGKIEAAHAAASAPPAAASANASEPPMRHADVEFRPRIKPAPAISAPVKASPPEESVEAPPPVLPKSKPAPKPAPAASVVKVVPLPAKPTPPLTHKSAPPAVHKDIHWSYEGEGGPENWGRLKPEYSLCSKGQRQSPIDIRDGIRVEQEAPGFDYKPTYFGIVNNGHTIQVNVGAGSMLTVMGRSYELKQFHFHHPAEERVEGRAFQMVAHLVHQDAEGRLAVVALLIEPGAEQALIQKLWNNLPLEANDEYQPRVAINLADLLPQRREHFAYMGSLTTPPCSEGVLWLVMKQPITLSAEQIGVFARFYPNNARPVQATAGRIIKESR